MNQEKSDRSERKSRTIYKRGDGGRTPSPMACSFSPSSLISYVTFLLQRIPSHSYKQFLFLLTDEKICITTIYIRLCYVIILAFLVILILRSSVSSCHYHNWLIQEFRLLPYLYQIVLSIRTCHFSL